MSVLALREFTAVGSRGLSVTASFIEGQLDKLSSQMQNSFVFGQMAKGTFDELAEVFANCRQPNWDGYDALPVDIRTFEIAQEFLKKLPLGIRAPSIGAEPDGHITMEWHRSLRKTLSVSISPKGELHFAELFGFDKKFGTKMFIGAVPEEIVGAIHKVMGK
ncbi:MAG: hypothetical protein AABY83_10095 [Pseudomonadota bacterium]